MKGWPGLLLAGTHLVPSSQPEDPHEGQRETSSQESSSAGQRGPPWLTSEGCGVWSVWLVGGREEYQEDRFEECLP